MTVRRRRPLAAGAVLAVLATFASLTVTVPAQASPPGNTVRFATYNASLNRNIAGQLIQDLATPNNTQAANVAEVIQRERPDVLLINEFDFDAGGVALGPLPGQLPVGARTTARPRSTTPTRSPRRPTPASRPAST